MLTIKPHEDKYRIDKFYACIVKIVKTF